LIVSFGELAPSLVSKTNPSKLVASASRMPLFEEGSFNQPCTTGAGIEKV
jgi:hypothetical protein